MFHQLVKCSQALSILTTSGGYPGHPGKLQQEGIFPVLYPDPDFFFFFLDLVSFLFYQLLLNGKACFSTKC